MTSDEREFACAKLMQTAHFAFIDIRNLSLAEGTARQVHELADAVELIPHQLLHWRDERYEQIRAGLAEYGRRYGGPANRLLNTLDLDRGTFDRLYRPAAWHWDATPETVERQPA